MPSEWRAVSSHSTPGFRGCCGQSLDRATPADRRSPRIGQRHCGQSFLPTRCRSQCFKRSAVSMAAKFKRNFESGRWETRRSARSIVSADLCFCLSVSDSSPLPSADGSRGHRLVSLEVVLFVESPQTTPEIAAKNSQSHKEKPRRSRVTTSPYFCGVSLCCLFSLRPFAPNSATSKLVCEACSTKSTRAQSPCGTALSTTRWPCRCW